MTPTQKSDKQKQEKARFVTTTYLDKTLQISRKDGAAFESTKTSQRQDLKKEFFASLKAFSSLLVTDANALSDSCQYNRIGCGEPKMEFTMEGYEFLWNGNRNRWTCRRKEIEILLHPDTDKTDAEKVLGSLKTIEDKILSRGLSQKTTQIRIGERPEENQKDWVTSASDHLHPIITLFQCERRGHLLASKIEETHGVETTKVWLHEIGHILESELEGPMGQLEATIAGEIGKAKELLDAISPHYFAGVSEQIIANFQTLLLAEKAGKKIISKQGRTPRDPIPARKYEATVVTREITAELVRTFYLEPLMGARTPKVDKTGWEALDDFIELLGQEKELSTKSRHSPPFRKKKPAPTGNLGDPMEMSTIQ